MHWRQADCDFISSLLGTLTSESRVPDSFNAAAWQVQLLQFGESSEVGSGENVVGEYVVAEDQYGDAVTDVRRYP